MNITFSGKYAKNSSPLGITFEAHVDGRQVHCHVSTEALQDIDSANRLDQPEQQFERHRSRFEELAASKIRSSLPSSISISSADVRS
jgi:Protein of unknown function (DUF1488)